MILLNLTLYYLLIFLTLTDINVLTTSDSTVPNNPRALSRFLRSVLLIVYIDEYNSVMPTLVNRSFTFNLFS